MTKETFAKLKAEAILDIRKADAIIKARTRYDCGLTEDITHCEGAELFFQSPDGQNGELYYELLKLGWRNSGWGAEYYWKVSKGRTGEGVRISMVEGDLYVKTM